jgi:hypothetical protein
MGTLLLRRSRHAGSHAELVGPLADCFHGEGRQLRRAVAFPNFTQSATLTNVNVKTTKKENAEMQLTAALQSLLGQFGLMRCDMYLWQWGFSSMRNCERFMD